MAKDLIERVLELQGSFTADKTNLMNERNSLVKLDLPQELLRLTREALPGSSFSANGSGGIGNNALVPWARIFDKDHSPSAQAGWYVVLLFAADGSKAYLSLNLGVTSIKPKDIPVLHKEALVSLDASNLGGVEDAGIVQSMNLEAGGNQLASLYERGNLMAFVYEAGRVPGDAQIKRDLRYLLERLVIVQDTSSEPSRTSEGNMPGDELDRLRRSIHWDSDRIGAVIESLFDGSPQVVFTGPPGTGKTYVAQQIAKYIVADGPATDDELTSRIKVVQFHPSYGYEEFVEGLRPIANANSQIEFKTVAGVIVQMAEAIEQDGKSRVLVIDEMNRANLPRVFGELMFLLEYRDRNISLLLRENFSLPDRLFIIGTMNTADRNIKNLDIALRRRFDFFTLDPDESILRSHYRDNNVNELGESLYTGFLALNRQLLVDLGDPGYGIGHSYLMHGYLDRKLLESVWKRQLYPLLQDYFSDRPETLEGYQLEVFWPHA